MANFYQHFLGVAERYPGTVAVEMQRQMVGETSPPLESYTYLELRQMSDAIGASLVRLGLPHGSRCSILANNSPRWIASYLGILCAGGVAVPLDTAFTVEQVAKLLRASESTLLFCDARHLPVARHAVKDLPVGLFLMDQPTEASREPSFDQALASGSAGFSATDAAPEDTAAILYTSGTTSDPKGVMLTHANISAESDAVFNTIDIGPTDALLGVLPLFHALAQMANLYLPLAAGARVVFLEALNTTELLRGLRERDITIFCCVPQFFYLIREKIQKQVGAKGRLAENIFRAMLSLAALGRRFGLNLGRIFFRPVHQMLGPRMRYLVTGGSRLDPAVGFDFQSLGFTFLQAYGLTETSGGAFVTRPNDNVIGSVGKALPGNEVKILDAKPAEDGGPAIGEVAIRGGIVMKGYYNRPDATAEVLKDGWLHTGDLGYLDAGGNLFLTGRAKEIIVTSSGKNIYPEEIEAHYLKTPFIKEICVIGLESRPGEPFAERLHGVIVPNFEVLRERKIVNAREAIRFDVETLSAQLPSMKRILSYELWQDDLPRTTTRKIKRFEVERRVQQRQSEQSGSDEIGSRPLTEDDRVWMEQPDVARALEVIRAASKQEGAQVHPRDNLELDLGLDSMERVELLAALEQELRAHVEDSVVSEVYTVRELVDAVRAHAGDGANLRREGEVPAAPAVGAAREPAAWDSILHSDPTGDPEALAVNENHPIGDLFWHLSGRLVNLFARDFFHLTVVGLEKLPKKGPYIISPNHQSYIDPAVLVAIMPFEIHRQLFYVGTSEIFGAGILKQLARSLRLIPVDPDANLVRAMRAGGYGLRHGRILVLYPEGERSIDGRPKVFKKGAAILSAHLGVPIYPVAMEGFWEAWPRGKGFQKFTHLKVEVGDPVYPPDTVDPRNPEATYTALTGEVRKRVVRMWSRLAGEQASQAAAD